MTSSRAGGWALALTATLTMAVSYFDRQTLAVLAPTVTASLGISEQNYGWLVSAFSLAYLVGAPLAGRLIDSVGARRGLLWAVVAWSLVAALHALAPGFAVLFGLRLALGLAEAPSFPGAAQTVHRALPPADRARGFGVLFTGSSLGAMVAPPVATFLEARWGFRVAFLGTAVVGLLWVPLWVRVAFRPEARALLDGSALAAQPGRGETARAPERSAREHDARAADRAIPSSSLPEGRTTTLTVLRHPAVVRGILVVFASAPLIALILNWGAKYLVRDFGMKQAQVGRYLWLPPLLFDAGAVLFGHFASVRAKRRIALGQERAGEPERLLLSLATAVTLSGVLVPFMGGPWPSVAAAGVALAGGGGLYAILTADMLSRVPPTSVSTAAGICAAAQSVTYIVIAPLIGYGVQRYGTYTPILIALSVWVLPGCVAWLVWKPPPPWRDEPDNAAAAVFD